MKRASVCGRWRRALRIGLALLALAPLLFSQASSDAQTTSAHHFWLTPDNDGGRTAHVLGSGLIGMGTTLALPAAAWWEHSALCIVPGLAKELRDYSRGSGVSRRDLRNDLAGCLGGVMLGSGLLYLTQQGGGAALVARFQLR